MSDPISILRFDHAAGGYLLGLTQPFLRARLRFQLPPGADWTAIEAALSMIAPDADAAAAPPNDEPVAGAIARVLFWTAKLQRTALDPVFEAGRMLSRDGGATPVVVLACPTSDHTICLGALKLIIDLINRGLAGAEAVALADAAKPGLELLSAARLRQGAGAADMVKFLEAAHRKRIPFIRVGTTSTFQLGHGARARWLDGSFTGDTGVIGAKIASNKMATASVLRQAGVPAPPHLAVASEADAVRAAEALGYPVVVKPFDLERGLGVSIRLKTPEAVRKAFAEARKFSPNILVETFIEGRDYRMVVLNGRLIWAIERVPGGVTGDGARTVRQLVDLLNADPRRSGRDATALKPLLLDEEAHDLLAERGMDEGSVPPEGQWIRLRGAANVASGGMPVAVFDRVHADNRALAERAARALRLDLAGVDLITPDIGRSWKEAGAGVCEVNAQPAFGTTTAAHLYGEILDSLLQGDGRIPIALIIGAPAGAQGGALTARIVGGRGMGLATADGVWIGPDHISPGPLEAFAGARLLLGESAVEAAVVEVSDTRPAATGLPFDRCGVVALAGARLADGGAHGFDELVRALLPLSTGNVVINAEDPACLAVAPLVRGGRVILYAAAANLPALLEHRDKGGAAVWLERVAEGCCLVFADGAEDPIRIELGTALTGAAGGLTLAAAVAWGLGCGEDRLRRGLGEASGPQPTIAG